MVSLQGEKPVQGRGGPVRPVFGRTVHGRNCTSRFKFAPLETSVVNLKWLKCGSAPNLNWCPLDTLNLDTVTESGVYVIWHEGNPGKVVYVGQGDPISARLASHRKDARITKYAASGRLRVTWATVATPQRDGVESYLANTWNPLVGEVHPNANPIAVNSPWAA